MKKPTYALAAALVLFVRLAGAQSIPSRLTDEEFWKLSSEFSEPDGTFRSDNLLSNEIWFQYVIPALSKTARQGRVYMGVGPEQNFTYIVALKPQLAFIIDVRRGNLDLQLMYKALFELSKDRAEFVSRLFSKRRPEGLSADSMVQDIFAAYANVPTSDALYNENVKAIQDHLIKTHHFPLSQNDLDGIEYVFANFYRSGPSINYGSSGRGGFGGVTYSDLMSATDESGLARSYLATGDYDVALEEIAPILQAQPRNFDILMIAGVAQLKTGKVEQALELFQRAKNLAPADAYPRINIGAAYVVQKKYGQALTEYEEALKLDPDRIDALGSLAQLLAVQRTHKAVIARVEQHLAKTKNKAEVYELLGQLSMNQQDYETALSFLGKAVTLNPDLFSASFLIASTYMAQKKFDQAIKESEKIIQKSPKAIQAYMLLGNLHDQKQQHDVANRYYRNVLELDKASTTAANNLAWNYAQYGGNLDVAFSLAQKARELNPNDESIADTLGWIYYKKGAYLTAIGLLKESSEKFKDRNPTVLYHLGMAYRKNGDNTLAKESFLKALKLDQNSRETEAAKRALDEIGDRTG